MILYRLSRSIFFQYSMIFGLVSLILATSSAVFFFYSTKKTLVQNSNQRTNSSFNDVIQSIENPMRNSDIESISRIFGMFYREGVVYAKITNADNTTLFEQGKILKDKDLESRWYKSRKIGDGLTYVGRVSVYYSDEYLTSQLFMAKRNSFLLGFLSFIGSITLLSIVFSFLFLRIKRLQDSLIKVANKNKVQSKTPRHYMRDELESISDFVEAMICEVKRLKRLEIDESKNAAIASTTQALAHDVRKPFSLLKASIHFIENVGSLADLKAQLPAMKASVERSLVSVEGMIQDVLELGKKTELTTTEACSPIIELRHSLSEVAQLHPQSEVSIDLDFGHQHKFDIDALRVQRVFSNILNNALQAMGREGRIWIQTRESSSRLHLLVGNSGSSLSAETCSNLFEAFYTSGKKGGTGLGLAIARKIVHAHQGQISVSSDQAKQHVEFSLDFPLSTESDSELHEGSRQRRNTISDFLLVPSNSSNPTNTQSETELELIAKVESAISARPKGYVEIGLLDDEPLYRQGIEALVRHTGLEEKFRFHHFATVRDVYRASVSHLDFMICDVDLGDQQQNGYDVVEILTQHPHFYGAACIHSNKALKHDLQMAAQVGALGFQPKPMTLEHLLRFVADNLPSVDLASRRDNHATTSTSLPQIAFIDDDEFVRQMVSSKLSNVSLHTYESPEAFLEDLDRGKIDVSVFSVIITDHYFGEKSQTLGLDLANELRKRGYTGIITLYSDGYFSEQLLNSVDLCLPKTHLPSWNDFVERFGVIEPLQSGNKIILKQPQKVAIESVVT